MAKRLRFSRFRRLPGIYRIGERKPPNVDLEPQRITLYIPAGLLDRAEAQSLRSGFENVQAYCEHLLERAIESEHAREVVEDTEAKRGALEGLDAIANDPTYLAEWKASAAGPGRRSALGKDGAAMNPEGPSEPNVPLPDPDALTVPSPAAQAVLRHAGISGEDASAFLPALRRGEAVASEAAQELLRALTDLEVEYRTARVLDRRVAYALHRLAFEGQVLVTDAWPTESVDEATVDILRIVQEAVDRVLSGEDIRYFAPEEGPELLP